MSAVAIGVGGWGEGRGLQTFLVYAPERHIGRLIQVNLERTGRRVSYYPYASEARAALRADPPDLLIAQVLDANLSEACELIRESRIVERDERGAVFAVVPSGRADLRECAEAAGADECFEMPFDPHEVTKFITRYRI
jgi:DNA-binding response OmpR family regulator